MFLAITKTLSDTHETDWTTEKHLKHRRKSTMEPAFSR